MQTIRYRVLLLRINPLSLSHTHAKEETHTHSNSTYSSQATVWLVSSHKSVCFCSGSDFAAADDLTMHTSSTHPDES